MGSVKRGHGLASFKQVLACIDEPRQPLHGVCSRTVVINFKLFHFSTSPPSILCTFKNNLGFDHFFLAPTHLYTHDRYNSRIMHVSCHDPFTWTIGPSGGGGGFHHSRGIDTPGCLCSTEAYPECVDENKNVGFSGAASLNRLS